MMMSGTRRRKVKPTTRRYSMLTWPLPFPEIELKLIQKILRIRVFKIV